MPLNEAPNRDPAKNGMARASASRPRLGAADLIVQFWRAKWLMLLVFVPVFALGLAAAISRPDQFESRSRLIVPSVSGASHDDLVQPELEFLRSPVIVARVLDRFPMSRLYPALNESCEARSRAVRVDAGGLRRLAAECRQMSADAMERDFQVWASSRAPVITATYKNGDAETSAEVLNALIGAYLAYSSQVLAQPQSIRPPIDRTTLEARLLESEAAVGGFLEVQGISNFEAERDTVQALYQAASEDLLGTDSRLQQVESQLGAYRVQIRAIRPQQRLFVEDSTEKTLIDMKLEREALLVNHLPGSVVVQDMDRRIARAETFIDTLDRPVGTVRTGPNPRYEQMLSVIGDLQAEAASLKDQQAALARQIAGFEARQARLTSLTPRYKELMRKRDLLERDLMSEVRQDVDANVSRFYGIRVLEPASVPVRPTATRSVAAVLAFLLACFAAIVAGLLKALTRKGFATRRSVERTLDLPVLATVGEA
ncbi:GumC family protein [Hyphomonas sp.]|uniref:GumC family protein n=1 Tax=Hyphomonas sp. TaxID=87 RepID=UPI003567DEEA